MPKKLVVIPTYNERANITNIVPQILAADAEIEVLVVDDSSPDGTADAVTQLAYTIPQLHLLLRTVRQVFG